MQIEDEQTRRVQHAHDQVLVLGNCHTLQQHRLRGIGGGFWAKGATDAGRVAAWEILGRPEMPRGQRLGRKHKDLGLIGRDPVSVAKPIPRRAASILGPELLLAGRGGEPEQSLAQSQALALSIPFQLARRLVPD